MTLERPKSDIRSVRVVFRDSETGKSKCVTLYDTTPEEAYEAVMEAIRRQQAPSAREQEKVA